MKKIPALVLILIVATGILCRVAGAATYHIRSDGGDSNQCSGNTDAPYQGSGGSQACAWSHP